MVIFPILNVFGSFSPLIWWWALYSLMAALLVSILELPILTYISSSSPPNTIISRLIDTFNEYLFKGTLLILISLSLWTSILGFISFLIIPSMMLTLSGIFYIISIWKGEEKENSLIRMIKDLNAEGNSEGNAENNSV